MGRSPQDLVADDPRRWATVGDAALAELGGRFRGELIAPGDERYDAARVVWNRGVDKHPRLIARCAGVADIVAALRFARDHELLIAVRGGGHNVAGNALCDDGVVIDLSALKGIHIDGGARRARVQPGVLWGELDAEAQHFGLATTGGVVSTTGVAGLTLGGGLGWLARLLGTTCDNLVSADVVLASGDLVRADAERNADLHWGLRGGGGNFGIVTSFELQLHPIGPIVLAGAVFHPFARANELLRFLRDFLEDAPDELTVITALTSAPPAPFLPSAVHGQLVAAAAVCYAGPMDRGEEIVRPLREFGAPHADVIGPMPYTALQSMFDASYPHGRFNYWKSCYLDELTDAAIDTLLEHAADIRSPLSSFYLEHLGGAIARGGETASAFGHRDHRFDLAILAQAADAEGLGPEIEWARALFAAIQPHAAQAVYVNNLGDEGADRVRAAYRPDVYERLVKLKDAYDPENTFRLNQNIAPTGRLAPV